MQIKKDEVKERILKAAREEFLRCDFKKASMRSIAKEAAVTPGLIYTYFENKETLFTGVIGQTKDTLYTSMRTTMAGLTVDAGKTPGIFDKAAARGLVQRLVDLTRGAREDFYLLLFCHQDQSPTFREELYAEYTQMCLGLLSAIAAARGEAKTYSPVCVRTLLSIFVSISEEVVLGRLTEAEDDGSLNELAGLVWGAWNGMIDY